MFTGIVSDIGTVIGARRTNDGIELDIATHYDPEGITIGGSIACDGVCLTVTAVEGTENASFKAFAALETLKVTNAGSWREGTRLNLERALRLGDELGGHSVLGHVDALAEIIARLPTGDQLRLDLRAPPEIMRLVARKGSVALNGTSLTVNEVDADRFSVHLIPHTLAVTNWADREIGDLVNLEIDPIARYAARLIETRPGGSTDHG
jgi:riboflavin synthase